MDRRWLIFAIAATLCAHTVSHASYSEQLDRAQHEGNDALREQVAIEIQRDLDAARLSGDSVLTATLLRDRWLLHLHRNQLYRGAADLDEARSLVSEHHPKLAHDLARDLAYTKILMGQIGVATHLLRQCVAFSLEQDDSASLQSDLYDIGDAYLKNGEIELARRYFIQSSEIKSLHPVLGPASRMKLANIARIEGNLAEAKQGHLEALEYFGNLGRYREIVARIELARDHVGLGELKSAEEQASLAFNDSRIFTEQKIDAALVLLQVAVAQHDDERIHHWLDTTQGLLSRSAEQLSSDTANPLRQIEFVTIALRHATHEGEQLALEAYIARGLDLVRSISNTLGADQAARLAWSAKTSPLVEALAAATYLHTPDRLADILETLYALMPSPGLQVSSTEASVAALDAFLAAERAVVSAQADKDVAPGRLRVLQSQRDIAREHYLAAQGPSEPAPEAKPVAQTYSVPQDHLFLRYFVREGLSIVIAESVDGVSVLPLPSRQAIHQLAQRIAHALLPGTGVSRKERLALLREARTLLPLEFIGDQIQTLVIAADDLVHGIPFNAINLSDRGYQPLHERMAVVRADSARQYFALSPDAGLARERLFVFADPDFSGEKNALAGHPLTLRSWMQSLPRLPYSNEEALAISSLFPEQVTLALGEQATRAALLSSESRQAAVLHIATHGYYDEATPDIVGLATAADGESGSSFLGLTEMMSQPFRNQLVVISGCETMLGRRYDGVGVRGLSQAILQRGAGAVLGTLWPVPDRPTSLFMRAFYEGLAEVDDVQSALDQARTEMMRSGQYADPVYWAGFVLSMRHGSATQLNL